VDECKPLPGVFLHRRVQRLRGRQVGTVPLRLLGHTPPPGAAAAAAAAAATALLVVVVARRSHLTGGPLREGGGAYVLKRGTGV